MSEMHCDTNRIYNAVDPFLLEGREYIGKAKSQIENLVLPSELNCNSNKANILGQTESGYKNVLDIYKSIVEIAWRFDQAENINHNYINNENLPVNMSSNVFQDGNTKKW